jgi:hypothetical protein
VLREVLKNIDEDTVKEWLQNDACELGFQHTTDRQTLSMLPQNKREKKRVGRMRVKKKKAGSMSVIAWCYSVLTLYNITWVREGLNTVTVQLPGKFVLL